MCSTLIYLVIQLVSYSVNRLVCSFVRFILCGFIWFDLIELLGPSICLSAG